MGICKCKKRTDLFCFVHKKAVCEQCICSDHQICFIRTYVEWLSENEYETPMCGICKGDLSADNATRLLCLDLFHPECIDVYASSLPPHTAQAGYVCPTCNKACIIPPSSNTGPLAQSIRKNFQNSQWFVGISANSDQVIDGDKVSDVSLDNGNVSHNGENGVGPALSETSLDDARFLEDLYVPRLDLNAPGPDHDHPFSPQASALPASSSPAPSPYYPSNSYPAAAAPYPSTASAATYSQNPYQYPPSPSQNAVNAIHAPYGVASRKGHQKYPDMLLDDEDEDKYRKKGLMQLFSFLGLLSSSDAISNKKGGRASRRRLVILFALLSCLGIAWILFSSSGAGEETETTETIAPA